jgi:LPS export ABC transporter protein LptC
MRTSTVKFARWALIGLIILTIGAVLHNYMQTLRRRAHAVKTVPQILPSEMKHLAESIERSDYRNGILRFKIRARRLLETRAGKSILQGIEGYDYNPDGSIRNEIRSQKAEYDTDRRIADFLGDVHLFIGKRVELRTDSLHYDLNSGIASTPDLLRFSSDQINGTARGLRFNQKEQSLALISAIDLNIVQAWKKESPGGKTEKFRAVSEQAFCSELTGKILFQGKAKIESDTQILSGEKIEAALDSGRKRIQLLTATGNANYQSGDLREKRLLGGDEIAFRLNLQGNLEQITVSGRASFSSSSSERNIQGRGGNIEMTFDAKELPSQIRAQKNVSFQIKSGSEEVLLSGDDLDAKFEAGTKNLESILARGHAGMTRIAATSLDMSELQADEIRMKIREFNGHSVLENLRAEGANGSARYISKPGGKRGASLQPIRSVSASLLEMIQSRQGDYFESGNASGKVVISENTIDATARPRPKQMLADRAHFHFYPGNNQLKNLDAEGHVQIAYGKKEAGKGASAEEFHTASDQMSAAFGLESGRSVVNSVAQWGHFTYRDDSRSASAGRCDYNAVRELLVLTETPGISDATQRTTGNKMEYDRNRKILSVLGNVQSIFFGGKESSSFFGNSSSSSPGIARADEMHYWTETERVRYSGKVQVLSENQQLQADILEMSNNFEQVNAQGSILQLLSMKKAPGSRSVQADSKNTRNTAGKLTAIRSSTMTYLKEKNVIAYSGKVKMQSGDTVLSSDTLDALLDSARKKVEHATAKGNVNVKLGARECKGDVGYYDADPGKFVVTGNLAEFHEPGDRRSYARRLTYSTADDTIQLEK